MRDGGRKDGYFFEYSRHVWKRSPDSEEIRQHLLDLLKSIAEQMRRDWYPIGVGLGETIVWQFGEFKERRAVTGLERIREYAPKGLAKAASDALAKIQKSGEIDVPPKNPPK